MFAEPRFEKIVRSLPIFPIGGGVAYGAAFGAEIVDIERTENEVDRAGGFFEIA